MRILIVGDGYLAFHLTRQLVAKDHSVTIIDADEDECDRLARRTDAVVVHGDGSDPAVLDDAEAAAADAVLGVTLGDPMNLAVCQQAQLHFGVPRTVALVNDPENEEVFERLGVDAAVSISRVVTTVVEERAEFEEVLDMLSLAGGRLQVSEVALSDTSPVAGQTLKESGLPEGTLVAAVIRGSRIIVPHGDTDLRAGDRLLVVARREAHGDLMARLTADADQ